MSEAVCRRKAVLVVLTLKQHEDGVWIRRLMESLERTKATTHHRCSDTTAISSRNTRYNEYNQGDISIQVKALEDLLGSPFLIEEFFESSSNDSRNQDEGWFVVGLVNRISDAASPILFKACMAVLSAAQCRQIPVFNGPNSYAMSANKWCHHVLFHRAQLSYPPTAAFLTTPLDYDSTTGFNSHRESSLAHVDSGFQASSTSSLGPMRNVQKAIQLIRQQQQPRQQHEYHNNSLKPSAKRENQKDQDILLKPNAGGFGEGIVRLPSSQILDQDNDRHQELPTFSDHMNLVQPYIPPHNHRLYRVWFLLGKIQCAVFREIQVTDTDNEFTTGCAGDTCSRRPAPMMAWSVPPDVRAELEDQLFPLFPKDCYCGSVEFLYGDDDNDNAPCKQRRLYFDWNMLSTLPIQVEETSRRAVWPDQYNPWDELAMAVWNR
jgi:glutathione synthase/RimK-type ligase-like ATP-grasp enzyme